MTVDAARLRARARLRALAEHSIALICANQAPSGAYIASPNFPVYRYSWLRDGTFIADAMSRAGEIDSAEAFFGWCARVIEARRERIEKLIARRAAGESIEHADLLPCRYTLDGSDSTEPWTDAQFDGYGSWVWALDAHARRHGRPFAPYLHAAELSVRYAAAFWDHPGYDWWEEEPDERHGSTMLSLYAGLRAVAGWEGIARRGELGQTAEAIRECLLGEAARTGHLTKWVGSDLVDASLLAAAVPFGFLAPSDPIVAATVAEIERTLVHSGGVHRNLADIYYGAGEWLVLAGFLGWHYAAVGRFAEARAELEWIAAHATPAGDLPEQVDDHLLVPEARDDWVAKWGPIATPLLWSHAMYLTLAIELGVFEAVQGGRRLR